ncbi:hypothetical protein F5882DRAFT_420195 [Hyaloscypha sp. PMI_1271]|nr:hypothetical protein F5882DRAFT_420195 [Hyaloscypha sp. PMI_1271]
MVPLKQGPDSLSGILAEGMWGNDAGDTKSYDHLHHGALSYLLREGVADEIESQFEAPPDSAPSVFTGQMNNWYCNPLTDRLAKLQVQSFDQLYDAQGTEKTTWRRTHIRNVAPLVPRGTELLRPRIRNAENGAQDIILQCFNTTDVPCLWLTGSSPEVAELLVHPRVNSAAIVQHISAWFEVLIGTFLTYVAGKKSRTKAHVGHTLFVSMLLWTAPVAATSIGTGTHSSLVPHHGSAFLDGLLNNLTPLFTTPHPPYPRTFPAPTLLLACLLTTTFTVVLYTLLRSHRFTKYFFLAGLLTSTVCGAIVAVDIPAFVFRYLFFGTNMALIVSALGCLVSSLPRFQSGGEEGKFRGRHGGENAAVVAVDDEKKGLMIH